MNNKHYLLEKIRQLFCCNKDINGDTIPREVLNWRS
jgi:hypothetical protein